MTISVWLHQLGPKLTLDRTTSKIFQDLVQALDKLDEVGDLLPPSHTEIVEID